MPLKTGNTVAAERRMDLASLFCMIGRHGPAVALAVIAVVSVLAGFIIYRTVRGKRRKATDAAEERGGRSGGAERDAPVMEDPHSSVESTDVSDEGSSDVKEDDLIQSDLKIRHRRVAAAEKTPLPYSPPESDIQAPETKYVRSEDTKEMAVVWDSCEVAEMYAEKANEDLPSDTYTGAEMVEDAVGCHQDATDDIVEDVIEEVHDNDGCLKEAEPIHVENFEKVLKAECWEEENVTQTQDVSDKTTRQEEENSQCALNNPVCFEQTPHVDEKGDDDKLQDDKSMLETNNIESNWEEPIINVEDAPAPCICHGKDEEFEEEDSDCIDCSSYSGNSSLPLVEEKKNEVKGAKEECVDYQTTVQSAEIWSSTFEQETKLPSTQQDQCDHVMDEAKPPIQDSDWDAGDGLAGGVIEDIVDEERLNKLTAVGLDIHSCDEQEVDIKQQENGLTCNQEDSVLNKDADEMQVKMPISDNIACSEEHDRALPCLSEPEKVDSQDYGLSGITTDAIAQISDTADFPDLSFGCQPQKEDRIAPSLEDDTDTIILGHQMLSHETENLPENNTTERTTVLAEESIDQVYDPHVQSCYVDQQKLQMINSDVFDKATVAADPGTVNITASVIVEEISCPQLPPISQDQQNDHMATDESFDELRNNSATDAVPCSNTSLTALSMSEEISYPNKLSSTQDQPNYQKENNEDFSEVTAGAAPVMAEDIRPPTHQIYLPSFEQSEQKDNDISSPAGEESGISSMAVSPDLQDAGVEFDMAAVNTVPPGVGYDLQPEGQTEAQNNLFADDVPISVINADTAGMVFGPYPSCSPQAPQIEHADLTKYESFAANEDMFGHEIEDGYHRAMDQYVAQFAASITSYTEDVKIQTDMKAVIEVVEKKEKKAGVSVEKKEDTKAEKEKEEDYEKTEISIMEATMDNNEWITESNYNVLPWLNVSAPSFSQDLTKAHQPPTEESQYSSAVTDTTCVDTTDIPLSTDVTQTSTLSLIDENTENNKKVVAVQPMPQNVNVTFRVHYFTQSPYQTVAITGNQQELGNWKGFIPLERSKDGHWATVVSLPAESHVEWKFVLVDKGEVCRWEECGNRLLDTGYGDDLLVHKWWGNM